MDVKIDMVDVGKELKAKLIWICLHAGGPQYHTSTSFFLAS